MERDGRNSDDAADWLLAQLAAGPAARDEPSVAPPPAAAVPAAPEPVIPPRSIEPGPRREEVLDWFSVAEPTSATDAATRVLPVIGTPPQAPSAPAAVEPPASPPPPATFPPAAAPLPPAGSSLPPATAFPPVAPAPVAEPSSGPPAWSPPFTVGRPDASAPIVPDSSAVPMPPAADPADPPPGPVTPTGPFALTWGNGDLDSEDAIRAAFRNLSEPSPSVPGTAAFEPSTPVSESPVPQPPTAQPTAPEPAAFEAPTFESTAGDAPTFGPAAPEPAGSESAASESPFAGFPSPPVARQSFTPAPGLTPTAEEPPAPPVVTPRHPIAPSTAPAGWDELAARPAPQAEPPAVAPPQPEPDPFAPAAPFAARSEPEPFAPPAPTSGRFGAFATDTFGAEAADPFRALIEASTPRDPAAPSASPVASPEPAPAAFTPSIPSENTTPRGFPFIEVRGEADEPVVESVAQPVAMQAESAANRRTPFPAFAAAAGDRTGGEPDPGEPVDDLLAALGSGTARPSRDDSSGPAGGADDSGSGTPPERGGPPTGGGFDALGLSFGDDEEDEEPVDEDDKPPARPSIRERLFGRGRNVDAHDDVTDEAAHDEAAHDEAAHDDDLTGAFAPPPPAAAAPPVAPAVPPVASPSAPTPAPAAPAAAEPPRPESPIAREIAETGYFWNLTPDPSAGDPNADGPAVADRTSAFEDEWAASESEQPHDAEPFAAEPVQPEQPQPEQPEPQQPEPFLRAPQLFPEEPEPTAAEPVVPEPIAAEPIAPEPEPITPEPIAPEPERPTFTASLFVTPPASQPEPELDAEPSWSFGDDVPDESAGHREDAPTAMFPSTPAAGPNATGGHDDDPLAALFGARPTPQDRQPIEDPWNTGSPFGASAGTSAPADRFAADAGPFAAYAASGAAPSQAPAPAVTPRPASAPRTGGGSGGGSGTGTGSGGSGSGGGNRTVRTLAWVAGGLVAALVLVGLFFLGTQLSGGGGGEASAPSETPTPTETPVAAPTAPQPAGVHPWNALFGGECLDPFESAWAEEFTVVDCAAPHAAQLVYRGQLQGDEAAPFPGEAELASQMNLLCTAPGVIDVAAVGGVEDLQVQAAFPVTEEQWTSGERSYYCFANRAGGEPLTASIAGPGPAA
ncbi:hypothetical protein [Agromyces sp. NPDC057865]|uniref:hypothetical protein n=1 Tax=Agromyces sp. NPDC057865 TaxID=3346267 RepID=UPI00366C1BB6